MLPRLRMMVMDPHLAGVVVIIVVGAHLFDWEMPLGGCSSSYCHQLFWCCRCLSFYEPLHRSLGGGSERGSLSRRTKWTEKKRGNWLLFSGVACHYCAPGCFGWFKDTFFQHFFFIVCLLAGGLTGCRFHARDMSLSLPLARSHMLDGISISGSHPFPFLYI